MELVQEVVDLRNRQPTLAGAAREQHLVRNRAKVARMLRIRTCIANDRCQRGQGVERRGFCPALTCVAKRGAVQLVKMRASRLSRASPSASM